MSKRKWTLTTAAVLAVAMLVGIMLSTAIAKPPTLATYKCIQGAQYFCTVVGFNPVVECCEWISGSCDTCQENWWYWYTDGLGNTYTCTEPGGGGTCVRHNCN